MRTRKSTTAAIICTERLLSDFEAPPIPPDVVHRLEYPLNALMRHRPLVERSNRLMVVGKTIQHAPLLSVQHLPSSARSNFLQKTRTFLGRPTGSVRLRRLQKLPLRQARSVPRIGRRRPLFPTSAFSWGQRSATHGYSQPLYLDCGFCADCFGATPQNPPNGRIAIGSAL